jgi:peptidoglycan/xylan/chitin deacetylase (PgdA/CDA1 family)
MSKLVGEFYKKGYVYFDWNIDSMDTSTSDPAKIVYNITSRLGNGYYNVLMHDTKTVHRQALPQVIRYGLENGYTFLPLDMSSPAPHHSIRN